jgi:hypothetical protein
MAPRKAGSVQLSQLARSIESAVKIAAARQDVRVGGESFIHNWEIIGRVLRDKVTLDQAYEVAREVTSRVSLPGVKIEPVVTRIGKDILVGFVERGRFGKLFQR